MNHKVEKFFAILILTVLLIVSSSSYYGIKGIDNLAYVIAIGLDVGKDNNLKLSLQLSVPNGDENSSSSSSQSSSAVVNSIECPSINSGISLFNSYLGKESNAETWVVHHKDNNANNNSVPNLVWLVKSDHPITPPNNTFDIENGKLCRLINNAPAFPITSILCMPYECELVHVLHH